MRSSLAAFLLHQIVSAAAAADKKQRGHGDEPPAGAVGRLIDAAGIVDAVSAARADVICAYNAGGRRGGRSNGRRGVAGRLIHRQTTLRGGNGGGIRPGGDDLTLIGLADGAGVEAGAVGSRRGLLGDDALIPAVVGLGDDLGLRVSALAAARADARGNAGGFLGYDPVAVLVDVVFILLRGGIGLRAAGGGAGRRGGADVDIEHGAGHAVAQLNCRLSGGTELGRVHGKAAAVGGIPIAAVGVVHTHDKAAQADALALGVARLGRGVEYFNAAVVDGDHAGFDLDAARIADNIINADAVIRRAGRLRGRIHGGIRAGDGRQRSVAGEIRGVPLIMDAAAVGGVGLDLKRNGNVAYRAGHVSRFGHDDRNRDGGRNGVIVRDVVIAGRPAAVIAAAAYVVGLGQTVSVIGLGQRAHSKGRGRQQAEHQRQRENRGRYFFHSLSLQIPHAAAHTAAGASAYMLTAFIIQRYPPGCTIFLTCSDKKCSVFYIM